MVPYISTGSNVKKTNTQKSHDTVPLGKCLFQIFNNTIPSLYPKQRAFPSCTAAFIYIYIYNSSGYLSHVDKTTCNVNTEPEDTWGKIFFTLKIT